MQSDDGFPHGEENLARSSSHARQADRLRRGPEPSTNGSRSGSAAASGFTEGSGEREEAEEQRDIKTVVTEISGEHSGREQRQEDLEMNNSSDSGNDSRGGSRPHSVSTNQSSGSTTGSGSSKSWKSGTGSPVSSPHRTYCDQDSRGTACSEQAEQDREHAHREMVQTVQEMKKRLPSEKRSRSRVSAVEALGYALNCVKQVQANSEYYNLLMCNGLAERKDAAVCTLEQLERITSEHALKNTDTFVVVFSLVTGRVVYASEQAPTILNCKRKFLDSAKFVELLFHQDVNTFYSHTAQPHLPPWTVGTHSAAVRFECVQVKSFFCRIRGGKDHVGEMRYNPFRITPYLLRVQGTGGGEELPCCLALVERITSGYEAPRIPTDKRIFTSTHSPGCVFLEVDDRAVPLLGYLPQDLIGKSLLTCLHPEDRTLMLAMHRKILKYAGQPPFEHSPIRFRCKSGDYVTLDTSWSSFVNPWSRKVAFIIGRHKVRTGPVNEDVFAAQNKEELPGMHEDIKELQAMIYKLFLQPVHTNGSSGYGSLGSNGSHEHYISVASSSDSNGNLWEDTHREPATLQQLCADVNKIKRGGQQVYLESRRKLTPLRNASPETAAPLPQGVPRVEERRAQGSLEEVHRTQLHVPSYQQINCVDSIIRYLESCSNPALKRKSESLSITTSSSSSTSEEEKTPAALAEDAANADEATPEASGALDGPVSAGSPATVAHTTAAVVGAPLTDITLSDKAMSVVSVTSQCSYSSTIVHVPQPESEVTALEDVPMGSEPADPAPAPAPSPAHTVPSSSPEAPEEFQVVGLTKEVLSAHTQKEEQEYVDRFRHRILESPYSSYLQRDNSSKAASNPRGDYGVRPLTAGGRIRSHSGKHKHKRPKPHGSSDSDGWRPRRYGPRPSPAPTPNPSSSESSPVRPGFVSPVQQPYYPVHPGVPGTEPHPGVPVLPSPEHVQLAPPFVQVVNPFMTPVMAVMLPYTYAVYSQAVPGVTPAAVAPSPFAQAPFVSTGDPQAGLCGMPSAPTPLLATAAPLPPLWPAGEEPDPGQPTALFSSSRSSSPLQLNLLQEELPQPAERQSSKAGVESLRETHCTGEDSPSALGNQDAQSTSSVLLDLLLQEDSRSGTGSNASGSGSGESGGSLGSGSGLGSNGTSTSHTGSSNSSKYFASNDSSDTSRKIRKSQDAEERCVPDQHRDGSLWAMIQHTPEPIMMTYQIQPRDPAQVLQDDREKLRVLQRLQPWFSQDQREELAEVHSWIHHRTIPKEINTQGCISCNANNTSTHARNPPTPDTSSLQACPTEDISPASEP